MKMPVIAKIIESNPNNETFLLNKNTQILLKTLFVLIIKLRLQHKCQHSSETIKLNDITKPPRKAGSPALIIFLTNFFIC